MLIGSGSGRAWSSSRIELSQLKRCPSLMVRRSLWEKSNTWSLLLNAFYHSWIGRRMAALAISPRSSPQCRGWMEALVDIDRHAHPRSSRVALWQFTKIMFECRFLEKRHDPAPRCWKSFVELQTRPVPAIVLRVVLADPWVRKVCERLPNSRSHDGK